MKLKDKIRKWLGIQEMFMGVDIGMQDQSCIVVCSRTGNGYVKVIRTYFPNMVEVERMVKEIQARYGVRESNTFRDYPMVMRRF